jgi:sugar/nucleoside kinase (ribokinase family)
MQVPDIVIVGHVALRQNEGELHLSGTGAYSSLVASKLGLRTALLTSAGPDLDLARLLPGVEVALADPSTTTIMGDLPLGETTFKHIRQAGGQIGAAAVPDAWRDAPLAVLAPLIGEVHPEIAQVFPRAVICAAAQGWLRQVGTDGIVEEGNLEALDLDALDGRARVLAVSEADLAGQELPAEWERIFPVIVVTRGRNGLRLLSDDKWRTLGAIPVGERDPTGAGDAFAAAFMVRYSESASAAEAARFAMAAASFVVEKSGIDGIPSRSDVEQRLREHPEVQLMPECSAEEND